MLIELQEPFKFKWSKGYLRLSNENRKILDLFNNDFDRTTISYARYLMGVKLGYEVPDEYEVDHKDNDKTNDDINNLQLLTQEQNLLKQQWWYNAMVQVWHILPCTYCHGLFYITDTDLRFRNIDTICCSKSCSAKLHASLDQNRMVNYLNDTDINLIKQLRSQGLSSYKIAEQTGFARNTVMKYW